MIRPLLLASLFLAACASQNNTQVALQDVSRSDLIISQSEAPDSSENGQCWAKATQPAIFETTTMQVEIEPAQYDTDDTLLKPAAYATRTQQKILRERAEVWFQTPCPAAMDLTFVATLQRALTVRGYFQGSITGTMDPSTRAALKAYQNQRGLASSQLALTTAQQLGVVAF